MKTLGEALDAYRKRFGVNYPLVICQNNGSTEELICKIQKCITEGKPAPEPVYRDDCDY